MAAPSLSPDLSSELESLRRRAYGRDADIALDPVAQQRLSELETLARGAAAQPDAAPEPAQANEIAHGEAASAPFEEPRQDPAPGHTVSDESDRVDAAAPVTRRSWWRRIPLWSVTAAIGIAVGLAVGLTWPTDSTPPPDLTLRIDPSGGERGAGFSENLDYWGVDEGTVVPHEAYDVIQVWTALGIDGSRCILLSHEGAFLSATCTGSGLDPVLDFTIYDGMSLDLQEQLPVGTVIRFVGHEGSVDVWVRTPGGQDPSATSTADSLPRAA